MAATNRLTQLKPSELGSREYWDEAYAVELSNHLGQPDEEGTVWFAESGAEEKVLAYLEDLEIHGTPVFDISNPSIRILDLGTGNGHMLFSLRDEGWKARMIGVDYSDASVELSRKINDYRSRNLAVDDGNSITFEHWDILKQEPQSWAEPSFDIVLDKGTFDAISLNDEIVEENRRGCDLYAEKVQRLIKDRGFLLVVSCNWTEPELKEWFSVSELAVHGTIRFPQFTFGGVKGQAVTAICFQKKAA